MGMSLRQQIRSHADVTKPFMIVCGGLGGEVEKRIDSIEYKYYFILLSHSEKKAP